MDTHSRDLEPDTAVLAPDDSLDDASDETSDRRRGWLKALLPIAVLLGGVVLAAVLIASREETERVERPQLGPLVETRPVTVGDVRIDVPGQGEVQALRRVALAPQITGRVVSTHPDLLAGGRLRAGETLLRIEPRDFELTVERSRAALAQAETQLERERAEADAARAEWNAIHPGEEPPALLVRAPQIRQIEAQIAAARAEVETTRLQLSRTRLTMPFDGVVATETVEIGQLVNAGQTVATIYGTDAVEVRVPLADRELAWIELGDGRAERTAGGGSPARLESNFAGAAHSWSGRVARLEGEVDPRSRMVTVVVRVDDPFAAADGRPPLLPGTFVDVEIEGRTIPNVAEIPRYALQPGDRVWLVEDETLRVRDVEVVRRDRESAYIRGVEPGERLVLSSLDAVTDGMTVRTAESRDSGAAPPEVDGDADPGALRTDEVGS